MSKFAFWKCAKPLRPMHAGASAALVSGMLFAAAATAVDLTDTVQLHGFASQGYVSTSANKYFGNSDKGSFNFRELGVNLSWQALPNLQFAAQIGSRKAGETEVNANPRFDYAVVDFAPLSGERGRAGVRAGRYRIPLGFYNQTRDVANSRPSIFLPESIYNDGARQLVLAIDGAQVYGEVRTDAGDFFFDYGTGKFLLDDINRQTTTAAPSTVWRVMYERDAGLVRVAVSGVDANIEGFQSPYPNIKAKVNLVMLSAQYNAEKWSLTSEYVPDPTGKIAGVVFPGFPPFVPAFTLPDIVQHGEAYYLQGTYRVTDDWEALLRYDSHCADKSDRSGVNNAAATGRPAYSFFAKDMTAGIGWSVRPDTKIRAEWHHVNGTGWLSTRENPLAQNTKQYWDMYALQVSYSF